MNIYKEDLPIAETINNFPENATVEAELDFEDANLNQYFMELEANQKIPELFFNSLNSICDYISKAKIASDYPLFNQVEWNQFFTPYLEKEITNQHDLEIINSIFHFYFILTSNDPHYCQLVNLETFIQFIGRGEFYSNLTWFFPLLSNFIITDQELNYFNTDFFNALYENIQKIQDNPQNLIYPIKFIETFARICFKYVDKDQAYGEQLFPVAQFILHIINYTVGAIPKLKKNEIMKPISIILEKMARRDLLDYNLFVEYQFKDLVRHMLYDENCSKLTKLISYYALNSLKYKDDPNFQDFNIFDDIFLLGIGKAIERDDEQFDINQQKYALSAIRNIILMDPSNLFKNDHDEFRCDIALCNIICEHLETMNFHLRKQALMLLSLIYANMPFSHFDDEMLSIILSFFVDSAEGCDDTEIINNLIPACQNIFKYLSDNQNKEQNLYDMFDALRDFLIQSSECVECFENIEILEKLIFN